MELFKLDGHEDKDYVSVRETDAATCVQLVQLSLLAGACTAWWCFVLKHRQDAHRIHYLMGLLCGFEVLLQAAVFYQQVLTSWDRDVPCQWIVVQHILSSCRSVLFFTVILLIGAGWSHMKPCLTRKETGILLLVVLLQVFYTMAVVTVTDKTSHVVDDWMTCADVLHTVDIVCCCAALYPTVWSLKSLRGGGHTESGLKDIRPPEQLSLYRQFYILLVVYFYMTRIVVYLLEHIGLPYDWVGGGVEQLVTLAFYSWTAVKFRPHAAHPHPQVDKA